MAFRTGIRVVVVVVRLLGLGPGQGLHGGQLVARLVGLRGLHVGQVVVHLVVLLVRVGGHRVQ